MPKLCLFTNRPEIYKLTYVNSEINTLGTQRRAGSVDAENDYQTWTKRGCLGQDVDDERTSF
jgi:hypothetical protein